MHDADDVLQIELAVMDATIRAMNRLQFEIAKMKERESAELSSMRHSAIMKSRHVSGRPTGTPP